MTKSLEIRNKRGLLESVEVRTNIAALNIPSVVERCLGLLVSEGKQYLNESVLHRSSARLFAWDDLSQMAVLQVKIKTHALKTPSGSREQCFLISLLAEQPFALPVPVDVVRRAASKAAHDVSAPATRAMMWIWNVSVRQVQKTERRRELLILPVGQPPRRAQRLDDNHVTLGDDHDVSAVTIARDSDCHYALRPVIADCFDRYPRFEGKSQWYALRSPRSFGKTSSTAPSQVS